MPRSCSQSASRRVNDSTPWNAGWRNARAISSGTRTDLDASRIGVPAARRARSSAFASNASRSTTIAGVGSGSTAETAAASRRASARRPLEPAGIR